MDGRKNLSIAQQISTARIAIAGGWEAIAGRHISAVYRLPGGVLVTFADGRIAFICEYLLQSMLQRAIDEVALLERIELLPWLP